MLTTLSNINDKHHNTYNVDIETAHKEFIKKIGVKKIPIKERNENHHKRSEIAKNNLYLNDFYLLFNKRKVEYAMSRYSDFISLNERSINKLINENKKLNFTKNSRGEPSFLAYIRDLYCDYYPEQYQPIAKFFYELKTKSIDELENIYHYISDVPKCNELAGTKLKYKDYLLGNYDIIADEKDYLDIITPPESQTIYNSVEAIKKFQDLLLYEDHSIDNIINEFKKLLLFLNSITSKYSYIENITDNKAIKIRNAMQNFHDIIKLNPNSIDSYKASPENIMPSYNENDDFFLLFKGSPDKIHNKKFYNLNFDSIIDSILGDPQFKFIYENALEQKYGNIKENWDILYKYEPEMYQILAHVIYCEQYKINKRYYYSGKNITNFWRVTRMSYKDYIEGNYKLVLYYKKQDYPHSNIVMCNKGDILMINNLIKTITILTEFINTDDYNDTDKINILKPLFIPLNTESDKLTIEDFCLSSDLLIGDSYQSATTNYQSKYTERLNNSVQDSA